MSTVNPRPIAEILAAMTSKDEYSQSLVSAAYNFSEHAHEGQKRYSGNPYFTHPAEVGFLLATAGLDPSAIAAGLLHDVIEDAGVKAETIEEQFGHEILTLIEGVTKLSALRYRGMERH